MFYKLLNKIYKHFNFRAVAGAENERMPLDEQKKYFSTFGEPKDDYERSFFKFKCFREYCYYHRKWIMIFYNIGAMLILPFMRLKLRNAAKKIKKADTQYDAVFENVPRLPNTDVIPAELKEKYPNSVDVTEIHYGSGCLDDTADDICAQLRKRYFWKFYFRLIVMLKLGLFNSYLLKYSPKAIAFYSVEREFSGPLQTLLCEKEGAQYIAFMHGDYLYALCFAFQRYSMYYTWDESYNRMFESLGCSFPMKVYVPDKLKGIAENIDEHECKYFATYYFSDETRACAEKINEVFESFRQAGLRCKIRPHPRFSNIEMLSEVLANTEMENIREYSLADSITDSLFTVGLNTTVLSQAYFSGKQVVIDDISMIEQYNELEAKGYIMMRRPHIKLTELVKAAQNGEYDESYRFFMRETAKA